MEHTTVCISSDMQLCWHSHCTFTFTSTSIPTRSLSKLVLSIRKGMKRITFNSFRVPHFCFSKTLTFTWSDEAGRSQTHTHTHTHTHTPHTHTHTHNTDRRSREGHGHSQYLRDFSKSPGYTKYSSVDGALCFCVGPERCKCDDHRFGEILTVVFLSTGSDKEKAHFAIVKYNLRFTSHSL